MQRMGGAVRSLWSRRGRASLDRSHAGTRVRVSVAYAVRFKSAGSRQAHGAWPPCASPAVPILGLWWALRWARVWPDGYRPSLPVSCTASRTLGPPRAIQRVQTLLRRQKNGAVPASVWCAPRGRCLPFAAISTVAVLSRGPARRCRYPRWCCGAPPSIIAAPDAPPLGRPRLICAAASRTTLCRWPSAPPPGRWCCAPRLPDGATCRAVTAPLVRRPVACVAPKHPQVWHARSATSSPSLTLTVRDRFLSDRVSASVLAI